MSAARAKAATDDLERALQVQDIRARLIHPKGAKRENEEGEVMWIKPPDPLIENLEIVLSQDPYFTERLAYNEFADVVEWEGGPLTDEIVTGVGLSIRRTYKLRLSSKAVHEVLVYVAKKLDYHPVRAYLNGLQWDGEKRIDELLVNYAGAEDEPLNREIGRRFLISAVARVMDPGCKVDTMLILVGPQGARKSTFLRLLCGSDWFCDTNIDLRSKDAYIGLRGAWLYEMAELASTRPRDAETVKAFLSAQEDRYRPPYGRTIVSSKRQCVFVGTTNETTFLNDLTGARRFWPVRVGTLKLLELQRDRDQLWAEAVEAYKANERWWLEANGDEDLHRRHEEHQYDDPWQEIIEDWLSEEGSLMRRQNGVTIRTILDLAIKMDPEKMNKGHEMRVAGILGKLGWAKARKSRKGNRATLWWPPS